MFRPARLFLIFALLLVLGSIAMILYIRLAPSDPARWHVDPASAPDPGTPNFARVDRVVTQAPEAVAEAIARRAQIEGAVLLAGDASFATWVARTARMGFPDYVSIRLEPAGEGTRIIAFSRSRFGRGDRGVNRARLRRWLPE